jgi:hypothetical protein
MPNAHSHLHTLPLPNQTTDPIDHEHVGEKGAVLKQSVGEGQGSEVGCCADQRLQLIRRISAALAGWAFGLVMQKLYEFWRSHLRVLKRPGFRAALILAAPRL